MWAVDTRTQSIKDIMKLESTLLFIVYFQNRLSFSPVIRNQGLKSLDVLFLLGGF